MGIFSRRTGVIGNQKREQQGFALMWIVQCNAGQCLYMCKAADQRVTVQPE